MEIIANRMEQEEDRRPGLEREVEELGYSIKKGAKFKKTYVNGIDRNFEIPQRAKSINYEHRNIRIPGQRFFKQTNMSLDITSILMQSTEISTVDFLIEVSHPCFLFGAGAES